jgi:uncharacterized protein YlxW (UPF0749 family)
MKLYPFTKLSILLLITGLILGLFLTAQWRAKPSRVTSPILPYTSLRDTRDILQDENNNLKKQITELHKKINENQDLLKKAKVTSSASLDYLEKLKSQIALSPLTGDGVKIILADSNATPATEDTIVHASDLRDLVNLLWANGASGITINDQRFSASTSIDCIVNTILINNVRLSSPFTIVALGKQDRLLRALNDQNLLIDLRRRQKLGVQFEYEPVKNYTLPAYDGSYSVQFSKILEE